MKKFRYPACIKWRRTTLMLIGSSSTIMIRAVSTSAVAALPRGETVGFVPQPFRVPPRVPGKPGESCGFTSFSGWIGSAWVDWEQ